MEEFDREQLPLIIMANWRGFSGGQRDLFEGVLQVRMSLLAFIFVTTWQISISACYLPAVSHVEQEVSCRADISHLAPHLQQQCNHAGNLPTVCPLVSIAKWQHFFKLLQPNVLEKSLLACSSALQLCPSIPTVPFGLTFS